MENSQDNPNAGNQAKSPKRFGLSRAVGTSIAGLILIVVVLAFSGGDRWFSSGGRAELWGATKTVAIGGVRITRRALAATREAVLGESDLASDNTQEPPIIFRPSYPGSAPFPADPQCITRMTSTVGHRVAALAPMTPAPRANNLCGSNDPLEVRALGGVEFSSPVVMGCRASEALGRWIEQDLPKIVERQELEMPTRLYHMGTFNCRKIAGSRNWSQHAFANAIDISGFDVPTLGRVSLIKHYLEDPDTADNEQDKARAELLKSMRNSLCRRFKVVLSPEFNAAHADHFHVDLGPYRICR